MKELLLVNMIYSSNKYLCDLFHIVAYTAPKCRVCATVQNVFNRFIMVLVVYRY